MIKSLFSVFLSTVLLFGLLACGQPAVGKAVGDSGSSDSNNIESEAEIESSLAVNIQGTSDLKSDVAATVTTCGVSTILVLRVAASASTRALSFALYFKFRGLVLSL